MVTVPQMIGLVTDSGAHLPDGITGAVPVEVVPLTVTIDDVDYLDGHTLDPDRFHAARATGLHDIVVSAPSPGQFAVAFEQLLEAGCTEVVSIHSVSAPAGTVQAARRGGHSVPVPVHVLEVGTTGFGVACCVRSAALAIASGAGLDRITTEVDTVAADVAAVFVEAGWHHAERPLVTVYNGSVEVVERLDTAADAINAIAAYAVGLSARGSLCVGIGYTDNDSAVLADALDAALSEVASVHTVMRYRIGAGHGIHTCPGTAGCFVLPHA